MNLLLIWSCRVFVLCLGRLWLFNCFVGNILFFCVFLLGLALG